VINGSGVSELSVVDDFLLAEGMHADSPTTSTTAATDAIDLVRIDLVRTDLVRTDLVRTGVLEERIDFSFLDNTKNAFPPATTL
jgi:hypothetical protein